MSTTKEYKEYIMEQMEKIGNVMIRPMMGEYLLYYQGQLFGGLYDSRLLFKITATNQELLENPEQQIPYQGAKPMLFVEEVENIEKLKQLILRTCLELPKKKEKK